MSATISKHRKKTTFELIINSNLDVGATDNRLITFPVAVAAAAVVGNVAGASGVDAVVAAEVA